MSSSRKANQPPRLGRLLRRRPGSVLILVVALLVLLALIGTAWMSTARTDLYAASQHAYNTQIDLLVDSTVNMVNSAIVGDVFENGKFRPASGTPVTPNTRDPRLPANLPLPPRRTGPNPPNPQPPAHSPTQQAAEFENYDSPLRDAFLRDRIPNLEPVSLTIPPFWRAISDSPLQNGYEAPYARGANGIQAPARNNANPEYPVQGPYRHERRVYLRPTYIDVPTASGTSKRYPALQEMALTQGGSTLNDVYGGGNIFAAADTDGDGVADAALWRLPVGTINGVTYYAAASVIDNNSAVNAAVAWQPAPSTGALAQGQTQPLYGQFFPTNISLRDMLFPDTRLGEMNALNRFRLSNDTGPGNTTTVPFVVAPDGKVVKRNDFQFLASNALSFDAYWHMVGARLDNPGYKTQTATYRGLSATDSMSLARQFILASQSATPSLLESRLNTELYFNGSTKKGAPVVYSSPVALDQLAIRNWYNDTFDFSNNSRWMPQRSVMVTRNPVSNFTPSLLQGPFGTEGKRNQNGAPIPYQFGDWVSVNGRAYVCIRAHGPGAQTPSPQLQRPDVQNAINDPRLVSYTWAPMDWATHPTKASVNTGTFGQLWVGFWSVMAERHPDLEFATTPFLRHPKDPDPLKRHLDDRTQTYDKDAPIRDRMFRNPIRDPRGKHPTLKPDYTGNLPFRLTPYQTLLLRSALAAVNTLDLRDSDDDVTSRRISLFDPSDPGAGVYEAMVYGNEKQPFITQVFAENTTGYVALELYNPYPTAISLHNWRLAILNRKSGGTESQPMVLTPLNTDAAHWNTKPAGLEETDPNGAPVIPPQGWLVITNQAVPTTAAINQATLTPRNGVGGLHLAVVTDLSRVFDNEVVLLKPRRMSADGTNLLSKSVALSGLTDRNHPNLFDENNIQDLIPVDSFDFTNLLPFGAGGASLADWHYAKANAEWKFVYPGDYDVQAGAPLSRHVATLYTTGGSTLGNSIKFGINTASPTAGATTTRTYVPLSIQLNNLGISGPNKSALNSNRFPFGGFARNGDILQVPFIGSYRLQRSGAFNEFSTNKVVEMNAITMDSVFAEDGDINDDQNDALGTSPEQIGRFCPVDGRYLSNQDVRFDDYLYEDERETIRNRNGASNNHLYDEGAFRYGWAKDLFDHVTVQSPQSDYLPNVDPSAGNLELVTPATARYGDMTSAFPVPQPNDATSLMNFGRKETIGVEGLVNINTAPWWVLAKVPFFNSLDPNQVDNNNLFARHVVRYRDGFRYISGLGSEPVAPLEPKQPFRSLFDLNRLLRTANGNNDFGEYNDRATIMNTALAIPDNPANIDGDISPLGANDDLRNDFEHRYLFINRVSNLLTTRSDSFTVYIQVQGWKDVGGDFPELVVQRRVAYIADRAAVTPNNPNLRTTVIPSSN